MRLNARAPIVIRGDEITHLDADGYKHLPRAASLPDEDPGQLWWRVEAFRSFCVAGVVGV